MLTKKQLEDAAECLTRFHERTCGQCSCNKFRYGYVGSYGCTENAAKTALAYRKTLERLETVLKQARAALKECAGISSFDGLYRVASIAEDAIQAIDELEGSEWER